MLIVLIVFGTMKMQTFHNTALFDCAGYYRV